MDLRSEVWVRLTGEPEDAGVRARALLLREGPPALRIRAARVALPAEAAGLLSDPVPGVRRAAAAVLGWSSDPRWVDLLRDRARVERCDEPRLSLLVAAARCGLPCAGAWSALVALGRREYGTPCGPRAIDVERIDLRWRMALAPLDDAPPDALPVRPPHSVRDALLRRVLDGDDRYAIEALGAQQWPSDLPALVARQRGAPGRRESLACIAALGLSGDPRAVPALAGALASVDDDPGHGFAARREAALAIGRIGDPSSAGLLLRALEAEARDFEGRPGAGLGLQRPVRAAIVEALGECGAIAVAPALVHLLGDRSGTPHGGLYLTAMDALWKLGARASLSAARGDEAIAAAAGVRAALDGPIPVRVSS